MATCNECLHIEVCVRCCSLQSEEGCSTCMLGLCRYDNIAEECKFFERKAPAADVVEVDTVRAWLYEMAMNNTDNYLRYACEEVISRLDGLKEFAKDGRKRG